MGKDAKLWGETEREMARKLAHSTSLEKKASMANFSSESRPEPFVDTFLSLKAAFVSRVGQRGGLEPLPVFTVICCAYWGRFSQHFLSCFYRFEKRMVKIKFLFHLLSP